MCVRSGRTATAATGASRTRHEHHIRTPSGRGQQARIRSIAIDRRVQVAEFSRWAERPSFHGILFGPGVIGSLGKDATIGLGQH